MMGIAILGIYICNQANDVQNTLLCLLELILPANDPMMFPVYPTYSRVHSKHYHTPSVFFFETLGSDTAVQDEMVDIVTEDTDDTFIFSLS